jgi:hypothetical protein
VNCTPAKHQWIQIIFTLTVSKDLTIDNLGSIIDEIIGLIRNALRKSLQRQSKIYVQPVILEIVPLPF